MGRHIQFADRSLEHFRKEAQLNIEALNHATRNIDAELLRMHEVPSPPAQLRGPAPLRRALQGHRRPRLQRASERDRLRGRNARHAHECQIFEDVKLPEGEVLIPGVLESKANFVEHPELIASASVATPTWSAART